MNDDRSRVMKSVVVDSGGCWNWSGYTMEKGYGLITIRRQPILVHRVMYQAEFGAIPAGKEVHHKCENKRCCNPAHLEALTSAEHKARHPDWWYPTACRRGHPFVNGSFSIVAATGFRRCNICINARRRKTA